MGLGGGEGLVTATPATLGSAGPGESLLRGTVSLFILVIHWGMVTGDSLDPYFTPISPLFPRNYRCPDTHAEGADRAPQPVQGPVRGAGGVDPLHSWIGISIHRGESSKIPALS